MFGGQPMHHFVNRTAATPLFREDVGTPPVGLGGRRSAAFGSLGVKARLAAAIRHGIDGVTGLAEQALQRLENRGLIINDENAGHSAPV